WARAPPRAPPAPRPAPRATAPAVPPPARIPCRRTAPFISAAEQGARMLTALRRGVLKVLSLVTASVLTACTASTEEMGQARQVLSHYALASCRADAYPSEPGVTVDAQAASGAHTLRVPGSHR